MLLHGAATNSGLWIGEIEPLLDRVRRLVPAAVAEVVPGAHALTCCFDRAERFLSEVAPVAVS